MCSLFNKTISRLGPYASRRYSNRSFEYVNKKIKVEISKTKDIKFQKILKLGLNYFGTKVIMKNNQEK